MERLNYQHLFYYWNVAHEESITRACEKPHSIDLILSDAPLTPSSIAKAFTHLLGESIWHPKTGNRLSPRFSALTNGCTVSVANHQYRLRRSLDQWFDSEDISPSIRAEIEDSALIKTFGSGGIGLFVAPTSVEAEVQRQYAVEAIGRIDAVHERFYAITTRRKLKHPAVTANIE